MTMKKQGQPKKALLKKALLLVPPLPQQRRRRRPCKRSHRHRPSWMVPRRRYPKKVLWTVVNKPKNELLNAANRLALLSILLPVLRAAPSIHLRRCRGRGRPRPRPRLRVRIERQLQSHPPEFGPPRTQQTTVFARAANSGGPGGPPGPLCLAIASESYNLSIEFAWDLMEVTCIWPSGDARAV